MMCILQELGNRVRSLHSVYEKSVVALVEGTAQSVGFTTPNNGSLGSHCDEERC